MPTPSSTPHAQLVWYIQAAERVWGPYRQARLASFMVERRLTAESLIATHPGGPFAPAGRRPELRRLFEPFAAFSEAASPPTPAVAESPDPSRNEPKPEISTRPEPAPEPKPAAVTPLQARPAAVLRNSPRAETSAKPPLRALVIWADLASLGAPAFETALAGHGQFVGVRPGVWLIRSATEAATLRNALSRTLTGEDALLVLEAPLERAAWFNLDHEAESNLRQLWGGAGG